MSRARLIDLLWPAGVALGVAAEWRLHGWSAPRAWIPDLLTGWTLLACGLVGWSRRPESWSGPLLSAAGFCWFVPNILVGWNGWLATHTLYLHRGPLVQLVLTYPQGGPRGRLLRLAVAAGWLVALTNMWRHEWWTVAAAAVLVGLAYARYRASVGFERRQRARSARGTVALGAALATTAAVRLATPTAAGQETTLHLYEAALSVLAIAMLIGLLRRPSEDLAVADLLVDLAEQPSPALRDALARALADPGLTIAFWIPGQRMYVEESGRPLDLADAAARRRTTPIERNGEPVAVLVHDDSLGDDPLLVEAIATAARLAATNARLHHELRSQVRELAASRGRLLVAADEERSHLEARLREGPAQQLQHVLEALEAVGGEGLATRTTFARVARARSRLAQALEELHELASGLHPRAVIAAGLADALNNLAERCLVPVRVDVTASSLPEEIEVGIYFVCSEALANVAKHAQATRASIAVAETLSGVEIVVEDDGRGGADLAAGRGLAGLRDRIETLGGAFAVGSSAGGGTRLRAFIPRRGSEAERTTAEEVAAHA